jgi:hypothetical protein
VAGGGYRVTGRDRRVTGLWVARTLQLKRPLGNFLNAVAVASLCYRLVTG